MTTPTDADLRFLEAFESCELEAANFGHRQHLRIAYVYLTLHPLEVALEKTEAGLRRLLAHLGAPASKYHETLTHAWLLAVQHLMHRVGATSSFEEFMSGGGSRLLERGIMETHYSPERLWSEEARTRYLEPDLQAIPPHAR